MIERKRGYTGMMLRRRRLAAEPYCRDCKAAGRYVASSVPDHIVPLARGGSDEDSNIRCLCAECHRKRTAEQFGQRIKRAVSVDGWPIDE